jgi:hypothetical protein
LSCLAYLETNWIVGAVMGQDPRADDLLLSSESEIHLAIPAVCVMEAISAFDWKRIERNRLKNELAGQLIQLNRSTNIPTAQQLAGELTQADLTNAASLVSFFNDWMITWLASQAERT